MRPHDHLFSISDVLNLRKQFGALVLDGRLYQMELGPRADDDPDFVELMGSRRRVRPAGDVGDLFSRTLETHADEVEDFRARCVGLRPQPWLRIPEELKERLDRHEKLRFVVDRLIPYLRKISGGPGREDRSEALGELQPFDRHFQELAELEAIPKTLVQDVLGSDVLLLGQSVYDVSWFGGDVRPRDCFLQAEGERYSVRKHERRHLMKLDGEFRERLKAVLRGHVFEAANEQLLAQARALEEDLARVAAETRENTTIYRDRERSVMIGRDGSIFCCQQVPPFVMQGSDRKYRLFERVRVGLRLSSLDPQDVLPMDGAYVMERYNHLFVFKYGELGRLCMGHEFGFFDRFWDMPLEQGIVEYLNAARLVICAGHFDEFGMNDYVPESIATRPKISLRSAKAKGLPVYRYYRK